MTAAPTGPPVRSPEPSAPRGYAAALRLLIVWAPLTVYASLQVAELLTSSGTSNGLKTVVFFATAACCVLLQAGAVRLEVRRIQATSQAADLDLLRVLAVGIAVVSVSVIATAFTGFEIAYEIQ